MAIVTITAALNMETADFWNGDLVSATSTEIVIVDGLRKSVITGEGFKYSPVGIVAGSMNSSRRSMDPRNTSSPA